MKKIILATALMAALSACKSCQSSQTTQERKHSATNEEEKNGVFSYNEYRRIYLDMVQNFNLTNYRKVEDHAAKPNQSNQNRIVYASDDSKIVVYLDLIYLPAAVGNRVAYSDTPSQTYDRNMIISRFNESILAYKNILIRNATFYMDAHQEDIAVIKSDLQDTQSRWDRQVADYFGRIAG